MVIGVNCPQPLTKTDKKTKVPQWRNDVFEFFCNYTQFAMLALQAYEEVSKIF